jgi:hypothetical protein
MSKSTVSLVMTVGRSDLKNESMHGLAISLYISFIAY